MSVPTEGIDTPELGCRCCCLVTHGNLMRLLLGSLMRAMTKGKSGGGAQTVYHWSSTDWQPKG
jgi:hypothetical protein